MAYWKKTGERTKTLMEASGARSTRVIGHRNYTDAGYKKTFGKAPKRVSGYWNTTDADKRVSYHRKAKGISLFNL